MKEIRVVSQSGKLKAISFEKASMIFQVNVENHTKAPETWDIMKKPNCINKREQCIELTRTKILPKTKDEQCPNTQSCEMDRVDETILSSGIEGRLLVKSLHLYFKYRFYCINVHTLRKKRSAFRITLRELSTNSKYDTVRSNSNKTSLSALTFQGFQPSISGYG